MQKPNKGISQSSRRSFLKGLVLATPLAGIPLTAREERASSKLDQEIIAKVRTTEASVFWPRLVGKNAAREGHGIESKNPVVVLETRSGAVGWGFMGGWRKRFHEIKNLLVGMRLGELFSVDRGLLDMKWHSIDFALHDLAGQLLNQPAWRMMGGSDFRKIPLYSGMIYFDDLPFDDPKAGITRILQECEWDCQYGYRQFKIKIGRGHRWMPKEEGLQRDIDVVRAIHAAYPERDLLVDANDGYDLEGMIRFLRGIQDIPLFWVEEPFRETLEDWRGLKKWIDGSGMKVRFLADGEHDPDFEIVGELEREGTLNLRLTDIVWYSLTRWRKENPAFVAQGTWVSPHTWGTQLKTVYAGHFAQAFGNIPTIEGVTCLSSDIDFGDNRMVDGCFQPSNEPGFGMTLRV